MSRLTNEEQRKKSIKQLCEYAEKTFGSSTSKGPIAGHYGSVLTRTSDEVSCGGVGSITNLTSGGSIAASNISPDTTINIDSLNIRELIESAERILLTFDMHYIDTVLSKCTEEHMQLLLEHLDHVKLMIEKKILERR